MIDHSDGQHTEMIELMNTNDSKKFLENYPPRKNYEHSMHGGYT